MIADDFGDGGFEASRRSVEAASTLICRHAGRLHLSNRMVEMALEQVEVWGRAEQFIGSSTEIVAATCVLITTRNSELAIPIDVLAQTFEVDKSKIWKGMQRAQKIEGIDVGMAPDVASCLRWFCRELNYDIHEDHLLQCGEEINNTFDTGTSAISPWTVASSVLYAVSQMSSAGLTQREVSDVGGVTPVSIRNYWRDFQKHLTDTLGDVQVIESRSRSGEPSEPDCDTLLEEIRLVRDVVDQLPSIKDFLEHSDESIGSVYGEFDSWSQAVDAACVQASEGFESHQEGEEDITSVKFLDAMRFAMVITGKPRVTMDEFERATGVSSDLVYQWFDGWRDANDAARPDWFDLDGDVDQMLLDLYSCSRVLGHSPSTEEFYDMSTLSPPAVRQRFGAWEVALEEAGVETLAEYESDDGRVSREEFLDELYRTASEVDEVPSMKEFNNFAECSSQLVYNWFDSWYDALAVLGLYETVDKPDVSKSEFLEQLRDVGVKVGGEPTVNQFDSHTEAYSAQTGYYWFDRWNQALSAAMFDSIAEVKQLAEQIGQPPTPMDFEWWCGRSSRVLIERGFHSWSRVLLAAGIEIDTKPWDWDDEERLEFLREVCRIADEVSGRRVDDGEVSKPSRPPTAVEFHRLSKLRVDRGMELFGSWDKILDAAGFDSSDIPSDGELADEDTHVTRQEYIKAVNEVADEIGTAPRQRDMSVYGDYGVDIGLILFGDWESVLSACGLDPKDQLPPTASVFDSSDVIETVQRLADDLDRPPLKGEFVDEFGPVEWQSVGGWESWDDVLATAGVDREDETVTKGEFLEEVKRLADELGTPPSEEEFDEMSQYSSLIGRELFGTWRNALLIAGVR